MGNDFIEGMEILINCKRYVENRIDFLDKRIEQMHRYGKETGALQKEVDRLYLVLNGKPPILVEED